MVCAMDTLLLSRFVIFLYVVFLTTGAPTPTQPHVDADAFVQDGLNASSQAPVYQSDGSLNVFMNCVGRCMPHIKNQKPDSDAVTWEYLCQRQCVMNTDAYNPPSSINGNANGNGTNGMRFGLDKDSPGNSAGRGNSGFGQSNGHGNANSHGNGIGNPHGQSDGSAQSNVLPQSDVQSKRNDNDKLEDNGQRNDVGQLKDNGKS